LSVTESTDWKAVALAAAMLVVGGLAWWLHLRPPLQVDASALERLPAELGAWRSSNVAMDPAVEGVLRADFNLQRAYVHPLGEVVWLYVGYYGTTRGGAPEHLPGTCYPAAGWEIVEERHIDVDPSVGLRVNEFLLQRETERRLVHFWYRSYRGTGIVSGLWLRFDHFLGQLSQQRADGALVRISTPIRGQEVIVARSRLVGFGTGVDGLLEDHWPVEVPVGGGG
jgi:EpsI family protein